MGSKYTYFLDLDGVLVDFTGGALKAHGKEDFPGSELTWGFPAQIGFTGADDPAFWAPLGHDFWANLDWTPEGKDLLRRLEGVVGRGNICLMTSPCATEGSVSGKIAWVERECPAYKRQLLVGACKYMAAGPDKVLIDDNDGNVDTFVAHGGVGVLVPRPWNRHRHLCCPMGAGFYVHDVITRVRAISGLHY